jgi:hypothetical protein
MMKALKEDYTDKSCMFYTEMQRPIGYFKIEGSIRREIFILW